MANGSRLTDHKALEQEQEYDFPYHYIDLWSEEHALLWSKDSLANYEAVRKALKHKGVKSVLDVGCGDGRLCHELRKDGYVVTGADHSARAIGFARALNPGIDFVVSDVLSMKDFVSTPFDAVTLVEVFEHLPPNDLPAVVESLAYFLNVGGVLVITVPSVNVAVPSKHYQHFSEEFLRRTVGSHFNIDAVQGVRNLGYWHELYALMRGIGYILYPFSKKTLFFSPYYRMMHWLFDKHIAEGIPDECEGLMLVARKK